MSFGDTVLSLGKMDAPIGRLQFFINNVLICFLLCVIGILFFLIFGFKESMAPVISIILGLVGLALSIINYAKRFWDLIGDKKKSIIFSVISIFIAVIPILGGLISLGVWIYLQFSPGEN